MVTEIKSKCYTFLVQSSPEPAAGPQKLDLAHQRMAHRLFPNINHNTQSNVGNHTRSKQAIIRTIHQTVRNQI